MRVSSIGVWSSAGARVEGVDPGLRPSPRSGSAGLLTTGAAPRPGVEPVPDPELGTSVRVRPARVLEILAPALGRLLGRRGPLDPSPLGDRPDGPVREGSPAWSIQPESWFELGNPNLETDLHRPRLSLAGRRLPALHLGRRRTSKPPEADRPRVHRLVPAAPPPRGAEYWFDPGFSPSATPGSSTAGRSPRPPARSAPTARPQDPRAGRPGARRALDRLGPGDLRADVEAILRHLQHAPADYAEMSAESGG